MAQLLLGSADLEGSLDAAAQRLARALGVDSTVISVGPDDGGAGRSGLQLAAAGTPIGELILNGTLSSSERARVRDRIVPSLESILAAAMHRAELQREVVETQALRRSDELKTAVLRSVSHDLRTPLTAILTAAAALETKHPTSENATEVREQVIDAATRLWHLIEKLLDLSVLQAGRAEPRLEWYSVDEVLQEAIEQAGEDPQLFKLSVEAELPLLRGDPAQLERAFANILENAARYSAGKPVSVRARRIRERIRVLVVDQGPGIAVAEQERIFLPFYRAPGAPAHPGSGLGLAITKGFLELNGARIAVESQSGHGTTIVVEFPLGEPDASPGVLAAAADAPGS
jgi:two-component system sensor histidine kinase KdpD